MYCNRCGNKLPPNSAFCNRCGAKVVSADDTVEATEDKGLRSSPPPVHFRRGSRRQSIVGNQIQEEPIPVEEYDELPEEEAYVDEYEVEEAEYAAPEPVEDEIIFQITPSFWDVGARYAVALALSLVVTMITVFVAGPIWLILTFTAILLAKPVYYHIQHNHTVYTLTAAKIEIEGGVFSRTAQNIPLHHVQDVTVSETFKERLIGIGDILIDSAALDHRIPMNNVNNPRKYAELILNQAQQWH
jgi:membrane protein YdbS with pleckstrin-like domain